MNLDGKLYFSREFVYMCPWTPMLRVRYVDLNLNSMILSTITYGIFPNVDIALRIFKTMAITNASSEKSFSYLKRIINYLRSTMSEKTLNDLAILSKESDTSEAISFDTVIKDCVEKKYRRQYS